MFLAYFILALFLSSSASAAYILPTCKENGTITYIPFLIDGYTNETMIDDRCTYTVNISSGNCSFVSSAQAEMMERYICFNESGPECTNINPVTVISTVTQNCNGTEVVETLVPIAPFEPGVELHMTSRLLDVIFVMSYECRFNDTSLDSFKHMPRQCLNIAPGS